MPKTIDEKQKNLLLEKIYAEHPEIQGDTLKKYCVEKVLEAYLLDPDAFNKKTTELMKKEKKKLKKGEEQEGEVNPPDEPKEIICITKIPAEENKPSNVYVCEDGMIKQS